MSKLTAIEYLELKITKLQNEIKTLREQEQKLDEVCNSVKLKYGQMYYYINSYGYIEDLSYDNDDVDKYRISTGTFFLTKEDAERKIRVDNVHYELSKLAARLNKETGEIDWNNIEQKKYLLSFDTEDITFKDEFHTKYSKINNVFSSNSKFIAEAKKLFTEDQLKEYIEYYGKVTIYEGE